MAQVSVATEQQKKKMVFHARTIRSTTPLSRAKANGSTVCAGYMRLVRLTAARAKGNAVSPWSVYLTEAVYRCRYSPDCDHSSGVFAQEAVTTQMSDMYPQGRRYRCPGRTLRGGQDEGVLMFALAFQCFFPWLTAGQIPSAQTFALNSILTPSGRQGSSVAGFVTALRSVYVCCSDQISGEHTPGGTIADGLRLTIRR
jgi:hypothetical protein